MVLENLPKHHAESLIKAITDLRPDIPARITSEDYVLFQLGFVQDIPCNIEICATKEDIISLLETVTFMECTAYDFSNEDLKKPEVKKLQRQYEAEYYKYAIIQGYFEDKLDWYFD